MTSNVGSPRIMVAKSREEAVNAVNEELHRAFRPEFLNRIDDKIVFDPLTREDMDHILEIQLKRMRSLLSQRELGLELTQAAKTALCDIGFDPAFGARPLKRAITTHLMNPMSKAIVSGGYEPGDTIKVDFDGERLSFESIPGPEKEDAA